MTQISNQPTIKDFLLARIAEDETYAYHALGLLGMENPWWTWVNLKARFESLSRADAQHIERHGPRRILRECAAKRAIIELADHVESMDYQIQSEWGGDLDGTGDDILKSLAAVYSDHPDYRQEWAA